MKRKPNRLNQFLYWHLLKHPLRNLLPADPILFLRGFLSTHLMKHPTITICGRSGFIFEGEIPQTYCFVPEECLLPDGDGVRIAEGDYIRSRWDVRNMRCNDTGEGQ